MTVEIRGLANIVAASDTLHGITPPEPLYRIVWSDGRRSAPHKWAGVLYVISRHAHARRAWGWHGPLPRRPVRVERVR